MYFLCCRNFCQTRCFYFCKTEVFLFLLYRNSQYHAIQQIFASYMLFRIACPRRILQFLVCLFMVLRKISKDFCADHRLVVTYYLEFKSTRCPGSPNLDSTLIAFYAWKMQDLETWVLAVGSCFGLSWLLSE